MRTALWTVILVAACGDSSVQSTPAPAPAAPAAPPFEVARVDPPAAEGAIAPSASAAGGDVVATWIEPAGAETHRVRFARLDAASRRWSAPATIVESGGLLANWADFPTALRAGDGTFWATSIRRGRERHASHVDLHRSPDGIAWTRVGPLHEDTTETEHGFASLVDAPDGVRAIWLDGRAMAGGGPMSLRSALVAADGSIRDRVVVDERVCDCCQTTLARTPDGLFAAYRDRSDAEIRDVSVTRGSPSGWSAPAAVHDDGWTMPGCPVNGPQAATRDRSVALAWYTEVGGGPRVRIAFSSDAGARFGEPVEVDAARPLGRVDVEWTPAGDALVSWLAAGASAQDAVVRVRRVARDGRLGEPVDLAQTGAARTSGFPRLAPLGSRTLVMWTDVGPPARVRGATFDPLQVPAPSGPPGAAPVRDTAPPLALGAALPSLRLSDPAGGEVELSTLRGRPLVVSFFATWCEPCREEYPLLSRLAARHGEAIRVVGVSLDDPTADLAAFARSNGLRYRVLHDRSDAATAAFGVPPLPATFVFDGAGTLVYRRIGGGPELERELPDVVARLAH